MQQPDFANRGSKDSPFGEVRGPTAAAARTREAASVGDSNNLRVNNIVKLEKQCSPAKSVGFCVSDQPVIDQWQPVPEGFKLLPKADLLRRGELIMSACLNRVEEFSQVVVKPVEDHIQRRALRALACGLVPSCML